MSPGQVVAVFGCLDSDQFQPVLDEFASRTGINVQYEEACEQETLRNCAGNNDCPDVAIGPWPGLLNELGQAGRVEDLSPFLNLTVLNANYADTWIDQGKVDGTLYGVWFNASNKSLVWYDPEEYAAHGWTTPTTWVEMMALSEEISNTTGTPPWSIGNESGLASGWPLGDWLEEILLRSAGPDLYDDLVTHDIPWTHGDIVSGTVYFGELFGKEDYQLGGKAGTLSTHFLDAIYPPFEEPPEAYLHHQATFAQNVIRSRFPAQVAGIDYSIFAFPNIGTTYTNAVIATGDVVIVLNATTEAQSFVDFLITTDAAEIWIQEGNTSPNRNIDPSLYPDPITRAAAGQLVNADILRLDLTDLLPGRLASYVRSQMDDLVQAAPDEAAMEEVLSRIEIKASHPYCAFLPLVILDSDP
jgi:alpha-glucoside transport system substrate-binding protein